MYCLCGLGTDVNQLRRSSSAKESGAQKCTYDAVTIKSKWCSLNHKVSNSAMNRNPSNSDLNRSKFSSPSIRTFEASRIKVNQVPRPVDIQGSRGCCLSTSSHSRCVSA